ncbi:MAG TPA: hypothetical protein VD997_15440 [Phycisphaerales bacterium]|nr:hypothetical protein [Phycisphaerales bacterium]
MAAKLRRDDSKIRTWKSEYDEAIRENDRDSARLLRDRVVYAQMALVREYHDVYIQDRFHGADLSSDAIEVATLGTSAAATVVGGIPTKAALAGASTILGAVKSPLLNGFSRLRITEAILSRMEKNRHRAHEALVSRLRNEGVDTCPLEAAELDCIDYFYSLSADRAVADIMFAED